MTGVTRSHCRGVPFQHEANTPFSVRRDAGLAVRYLRAAGYDTLLAAGGRGDSELPWRCHAEGRYFLTCDRLVREHKAAQGVALILSHGDPDRLAAMLSGSFEMDWLMRAFTRCLLDNTPLVAAGEAARERVPDDVCGPGEPLLECPQRGRVYWRGSHHKRLCAKPATLNSRLIPREASMLPRKLPERTSSFSSRVLYLRRVGISPVWAYCPPCLQK
jgi:hypothetical protein